MNQQIGEIGSNENLRSAQRISSLLTLLELQLQVQKEHHTISSDLALNIEKAVEITLCTGGNCVQNFEQALTAMPESYIR